MSTKSERKGVLDRPDSVKRIYQALLATSIVLLAADALYEKHVHYDFEGWFGFYGIYGFVSCVGLVLVAKELRKLLMRNEDYYE